MRWANGHIQSFSIDGAHLRRGSCLFFRHHPYPTLEASFFESLLDYAGPFGLVYDLEKFRLCRRGSAFRQRYRRANDAEGAREFEPDSLGAEEIGRLWSAIEKSVKAINGAYESAQSMHRAAA